MRELSKEYINSFYDKSLLMHGDRPESLGWNAGGQPLHYRILLDIDADLRGKRVLDYGCGRGDLYRYLMERDIPVDYTGFDINENFVSIARRKYPECNFEVFDAEEDMLKEDFDYIFLCGVFNLETEGIDETIRKTLASLFRRCRKAMAYNGLSAHDPVKDIRLHYVYPEDMVRYAVKNLSPYFILKNDVIPYDFTLFIYRDRVDNT